MTLYLSLGSNLGDRQHYLDAATSRLIAALGPCVAASAVMETAPVEMDSCHRFLNAAIALRTAETDPMALLEMTQRIERELGRTRKSSGGQHYDRTIDIDLLRLFDDAEREVVVQHPRLTLPHPRIAERDFMRLPLEEILLQEHRHADGA